MTTFTLGEHDFLLDGHPHRILSGAIHYFRIHPDQWADRIHKARLLGLNTIETYVAWNAHEPVEGQWSWQDGLDLAAFLKAVADEGMHAIVRPAPYICAEWDDGGLPAWLFGEKAAGVRRDEPVFMAAVEAYLRRVYEIIAPLQIDRGGPVILVQIENEYGAYGSDPEYLRKLVGVTRSAGITVPLTTVDQPEDDMLAAGSLPGLLHTGSFGSRSPERLATLRRHQPSGPLMCMEYWNGWFDNWGTPHHTTEAGAAAADLDALLGAGASVNLYMLCGGTNFGLTNGANDKGTYEPITTSYDYDAPLDEAGRPTAKYWAFREVIGKYTELPDEEPEPAGPAPVTSAPLPREIDLLDAVEASGTWSVLDHLPAMDEMGQFRGFALYRARIELDDAAELSLAEVRDRALVFAGDRLLGVLDRAEKSRSVQIPDGSYDLTLLVEDQGRVDYGPRLGEPKGLIGPAMVRSGKQGLGRSGLGQPGEQLEITDWQYLTVPDDPGGLLDGSDAGRRTPPERPVLRQGRLNVDGPADLFLDTAGWGKGVAWFNGVCLGRFWERGPQRTLYVPAPMVRAGANDVVVMDLHPRPGARIATLSAPVLDQPILNPPVTT